MISDNGRDEVIENRYSEPTVKIEASDLAPEELEAILNPEPTDSHQPVQISETVRLTAEAADIMNVDYLNPCKDNPQTRIMPFGKMQFFDCYLPEGYFISQKGVWKIIQKHDRDQRIINVPELICTTRAMVTGYYTCEDDSDVVEISYMTDNKEEVMRVPLNATLGTREWKELVRKNNIGRLDITDNELTKMIDFFKAVKQVNQGVHEGEEGTMFKRGEVYTVCGWKDKAYTKFVSGSRLFTEKKISSKPVFQQSECIFLDAENNTHLDKKLVSKGTLEGWVRSVENIIKYPRVRFACYKQMDIILAEMLGAIPCTLAIVFPTSNGKTVTLICIASMIGDPNDNGEGLLLPGDISKPALNAHLRVCRDHTLLVDDLSNMKEDMKKNISYIPANRQESLRSKTDGKLRDHKPFMSNLIATSEHPIISDRASDGADSRLIDEQKPPIPQIEDKTIREAKIGMKKNYGHILGLFLNKISEHRDELPIWYEEAITRIQTGISSTKIKRQADYYALAEVAGRLLEEIFDEIGLESMDPAKVVDQMWQECVIDRNYKSQYVKFVESIWDFYIQNSSKHFVKGDTVPTEGMTDIYGWDCSEYVDFVPKKLRAELKNDEFDKTNSLFNECMHYGLIESNGDSIVKSTWHFKEIGGKKSSMTVIRLVKNKVYEHTSIEDPVRHAEEEKKQREEQIAIKKRLAEEQIAENPSAVQYEW